MTAHRDRQRRLARQRTTQVLGGGTRPAGVGQRGNRRGAGDFGLGDFVRSSGTDGGTLGNNGGFLIARGEDFLGGQ